MIESQIKKLLKAGKDPLELSIKKWEDIVNKTGKDAGRLNCALCLVYLENNCADCPVRDYTGDIVCSNTPYEEWSYHMIWAHDYPSRPWSVKCKTCMMYAKRELAFLKSLRRNKELESS